MSSFSKMYVCGMYVVYNPTAVVIQFGESE